jgi:hypothetical protein
MATQRKVPALLPLMALQRLYPPFWGVEMVAELLASIILERSLELLRASCAQVYADINYADINYPRTLARSFASVVRVYCKQIYIAYVVGELSSNARSNLCERRARRCMQIYIVYWIHIVYLGVCRCIAEDVGHRLRVRAQSTSVYSILALRLIDFAPLSFCL